MVGAPHLVNIKYTIDMADSHNDDINSERQDSTAVNVNDFLRKSFEDRGLGNGEIFHSVCDSLREAESLKFIPVTNEKCSPRAQCGICTLYVEKMVITKCGHRLCEYCLSNLRSDACPNCRTRLSLPRSKPPCNVRE